MQFFKKSLLAGVVAVSMLSAAPVLAQSAEAFMIIRFNQPRMYFDQQLYNAVSQAVGIKQDVMFEVIAYAPQTGDAERDAQWQKQAARDLSTVVQRMNSIGVPSSRLTTSVQMREGIKYDEVHLFAY